MRNALSCRILSYMNTYNTVTEAVKGLKDRGFTIDFNTDFDCIVCNTTPIRLAPSEFEISEVHRFEGDSDPADEAVVYGIVSKHGEKGVLVNGYGPTSNAMSDQMVEKLKIRH